jgi:hypothetical protein
MSPAKPHTSGMTITLPADLEKLLERAAQSRGLPVDAYARAVLEEAVKFDRETLLAEIDRIRAMTPTGPQTDSAELLHQACAERYDR